MRFKSLQEIFSKLSATEFSRWRSTSNEREKVPFFCEAESQVGAERPNELDSSGSLVSGTLINHECKQRV